MAYITINGLDHFRVSTFSWASQYKITLSWDLLDWIAGMYGIPCLFSNFITTPELSGATALYISPDIYHTQITECSLETFLYISEFSLCIERLPNSYSVSSHPNFYNGSDSFSEHISRALPTEMIFYLLRSIPSESLILYSGNLKFEILEAIVKWLQVSVSEYATDQSEI